LAARLVTGREGGARLAAREGGPGDGAPVVVLVRPQLAENIGATARAMANGGLFRLRLVAPRDGWPQEKAWRTASGADRILDAAEIFSDVGAAVGDLHRVFATCPRPRHVIKPLMTARGAAAELRAIAARRLGAGILFGPERAGLEAEDMTRADVLVRYPLNPDFASLNLAQAVMVMAYEWWVAGDPGFPPRRLMTNETRVATKAELENFLAHLVAELDAAGFLRNKEKRPGMVRNIRHFFTRGEVTEQELATLHGIVTELARGRRVRGRVEPDMLPLDLCGEAPGQEPPDDARCRGPGQKQEPAEILAVDDEIHADAQHDTADQPPGDPGGDAEPEDFLPPNHRPLGTGAGRV
jgi:tRNA/rRNA methyltransferase